MTKRAPISAEAHRRLLIGMDEFERQKRAAEAAEGAALPVEPGTRTHLPTAPCFNCGARGWCDHRKEEDQ